MTYATYTRIIIEGYLPLVLDLKGRQKSPVWRTVDSQMDQNNHQELNAPDTTPIHVGASITWDNSPLHDTVVLLPDQVRAGHTTGTGLPVAISGVLDNPLTGTILTITFTPAASPADQQAPVRILKMWSDNTTTLQSARTFTTGGAAYTFTVDLIATRPGSSATLLGINLDVLAPPQQYVERFFGIPYTMGDFTILLDNLRLDGDHLVYDYEITGGWLEDFTFVVLQLGHRNTTTGALEPMTSESYIRHDDPHSGTHALNESTTDPHLWMGDTTPTHYYVYASRRTAANTEITPFEHVGHQPTDYLNIAGTPFSGYDSGPYITPLTMPQTVVFDWSENSDAG